MKVLMLSWEYPPKIVGGIARHVEEIAWSLALAKIGAAVHFLDVGGIPVADAKALETMLKGAREKARGDDALLAEAMRVFDLLYSGYSTSSRS